MLNTRNVADLQRLVDESIEEGLTLDYKASPALGRDSPSVNELCKDVSALANSAGGQIIYGIEEDKATHKPSRIDEGVTDPKITREWVEQILNSKIQPRILAVRIDRYETGKGGFAFVITVPASQVGPHQAPDKKYYRRFELQSVPMEDYELKDVMRRATTPDLFVSLSFLNGQHCAAEFGEGQNTSNAFNLIARIENRSPQPAYHAIVDIGIDTDFGLISRGGYDRLATANDIRGTPMNWFRWSRASPPGLPIFREHPTLLNDNVLMLAMERQATIQRLYDLTVNVFAPGFTSTEHWAIHARGHAMTIYPPGSPWAASRKE